MGTEKHKRTDVLDVFRTFKAITRDNLILPNVARTYGWHSFEREDSLRLFRHPERSPGLKGPEDPLRLIDNDMNIRSVRGLMVEGWCRRVIDNVDLKVQECFRKTKIFDFPSSRVLSDLSMDVDPLLMAKAINEHGPVVIGSRPVSVCDTIQLIIEGTEYETLSNFSRSVVPEVLDVGFLEQIASVGSAGKACRFATIKQMPAVKFSGEHAKELHGAILVPDGRFVAVKVYEHSIDMSYGHLLREITRRSAVAHDGSRLMNRVRDIIWCDSEDAEESYDGSYFWRRRRDRV